MIDETWYQVFVVFAKSDIVFCWIYSDQKKSFGDNDGPDLSDVLGLRNEKKSPGIGTNKIE